MTFWQNVMRLLVRKDTAIAQRPHYIELENPDSHYQFAGHYNLFLLFSREARDRPLLSFLFRPIAIRHRGEAILASDVFPGALGSRALERLSDGDIDGAVKDLQEVVVRQEAWNASEYVTEQDHLLLFRYLSLCGNALGKIGHFSEGRYYFTASLEKYRQLPPLTQVDEAAMAQDTVQMVTWYLLLEMKYAEALGIVREALSNFSFSSYQSNTVKSLEEMREVLERLVPNLSDFKADAATNTLFAELLGRVERCETAEGARKLRQDIITELKQRSSDLGLKRSRDATIASIRKHLDLLSRMSSSESRKPTSRNLLSEEQIRERFTDEADRRMIRDTQAFARANEESMQQFYKVNDELTRTMTQFSEQIAEGEIAFISSFPEQPFTIPPSERKRWLLLELVRFGTQILLIAYVLEELVKKLVEEGGSRAIVSLDFKDKELWLKLGVFILIFTAGKIVEKVTDKRQLVQYKMALTSLVMDRARVLWLSYNILESAAKRAKDSLEKTEDNLKKALEEKRKRLESRDHFDFGEFGELYLTEKDLETSGPTLIQGDIDPAPDEDNKDNA